MNLSLHARASYLRRSRLYFFVFRSTCCGDMIQYLWLPHHLPLALLTLHTIGFSVAMVHVDIHARHWCSFMWTDHTVLNRPVAWEKSLHVPELRHTRGFQLTSSCIISIQIRIHLLRLAELIPDSFNPM